jgi:hypothetical protein
MSRSVSNRSLPEEIDDDVFIGIGSRVLDMWNSKEDDRSASSPSGLSPAARLQRFLLPPVGALPDSWEEEVLEIVDQMSPADFAFLGARLIRFFLQISSPVRDAEVESRLLAQAILTRKPPRPVRSRPRTFPRWLPTLGDVD